MRMFSAAYVLLFMALAGCVHGSKRVTCPALIDWPSAFQSDLAGELEAHSATDMPAFHELALRAERQRAAVKGCK